VVETLATTQTETTDVGLASTLVSSDTAAMAEHVLDEAVAFCAIRMGVDGSQVLPVLLDQDDRLACEYFFYGVAKQVAACLGAMDEYVRAVYLLDHDATPEDICFGTLNRGTPLLHLIVWTGRKTAALCSLVAGLDRALVEAYAERLGKPQVKSLLDVQVIDDLEVENRTGYGALIHTIHHCPIPVWER